MLGADKLRLLNLKSYKKNPDKTLVGIALIYYGK